MRSPKTPPQISRLSGIPIAKCWEKVRRLESLGLIRPVLNFVSKSGKAVLFFETQILHENAEETGLENLVTALYLV